MECSRDNLSTPLPVVALPCGSRSISNTRRLVATREAARLIQVVVLPTPPFWLAIANTLAMVFPTPRHASAQYQQMPLALATRHVQVVFGFDLEIFRECRQLLARMQPLHGQPVRLFIA